MADPKDYGGKIDGAIKINKHLAAAKKINEDDKYYLKVNSGTGNVEVYARRPTGEITQIGTSRGTYDEIKIGDYDAKKGKFRYIEDAATDAEREFFSDPKIAKEYITEPAKTILTKGLRSDGIANNTEEAKKKAEDTIDGTENPDLTYSNPNENALNERLSTFQKTTKGIARRTYEVLKYPETLNTETQDSIKFTLKELTSIKFSASLNAEPFKRQYSGENLEGSVTLPIQSGISDSNLVKWGPNELDAIRATAAAASLTVADSRSSEEFVGKLGSILTDAQKTLFDEGGPFKQAIMSSLAGEAVGVQGLLSRTTGTVLNPNLELLFQGPQLRPFTFQFRLSPREATEATKVKKIIRFFKQAMSVKTTSTNAFLKTPHVFDIVYQTNGGNIHQSLNRIKTCALLGCDVDYTPDGTYSTFNDAEKTMTSYNLTLRFNELEPIFDKDYNADSEDLEGAENFMLLPTLEEEVSHTIGF